MHDSLVVDLDSMNPKEVCNDSRSILSVAKEQLSIDVPEIVYHETSNGHEYALFVFMVLCIMSIGTLFYMQYRSRRELNVVVGRASISETHLISNSLDGNY